MTDAGDLVSQSLPQGYAACPHPPDQLQVGMQISRALDADDPDVWGQYVHLQAECGMCKQPLSWDIPRVGVMAHDATTDATGYQVNLPLAIGNQEGVADVLVNSVRDAPPQELTTRRLRLAINDPGKFTVRVEGETRTSWVARACVVALPGFTWDGEGE